MIAIVVCITVLYTSFIGYLFTGILQNKRYDLVVHPEKQDFSILIPFRNESENLPSLLQSISQLNYDTGRYEILFINDHSNDNSVQLITAFKQAYPELPIVLLNSELPSKKAALKYGISKAQHNWILTTDADCVLPSNWIECYNTSIDKYECHFFAGPVSYTSDGSFLQEFQYLDFLSLQGTTLATFQKDIPFLCNGANLCFYKPVFYEVNGFDGNSHIASGDDVFLLEKFVKHDLTKVQFISSLDCLVTTRPEKTWKSLFSQRIRWAAKTTAINRIFPIALGFSVFLINLFILILFILAPRIGVFLFAIKFVVDFLFLSSTSRFFCKRLRWKPLLFSAILYPLFSAMVVLSAFTTNYTWKDRRYRK